MANDQQIKDVVFSDFLTEFSIHPVKRDLVRATNEAAVKRSLKNLLMINKGERYFRPDLGGNIRRYLFEPMTPFTAISLKSEIQEVIRNHEPRVTIITVTVIPVYEQNSYQVRLVYYMVNKSEPISHNVTLERIR